MDQKVENRPYDVEAIRRDFPILAREVYGKKLVYLDNAASAQKPQAVIDAIAHAYGHEYANVHRGLHFLSNAATDAYEKAREKVRGFLNAESVDEIVFTKSATEAINTVAYGWGMPHIGEGDEIVLSIMEHHSNIVPWHFIRERQGAKLVWVPVDEDGAFHIEEFEKRLTDRTKLIAITHMSNALGTVVPIRQIVEIAHARGIKVMVDGSQGAVHLPVDVREFGCDFYVMTGHKLYGPTGIGVLYGKFELLDQLDPLMVGGGSNARFDIHGNLMLKRTPVKFEAGTPPIGGVMGLGAAIDYLSAIGMENIMEHERELRSYLMAALNKLDNFKVYNHDATSGIIALNVDGIFPQDVSVYLNSKNIAIRAGDHCAKLLVNLIGVPNTVRVSFYFYNTKEEVDKLIEAFQEITLEKCIELAI